MAKLSISQAWSETGTFVAKEGRLLLPVALLLLVIPGIVAQLLGPQPGTERTGGEIFLDLVLTLLNLVAALVGVLAITHLAMRPGASVGEALQVGVRRFFPLFLATLLLGFVFGLIGILVISLFAGASLARGNVLSMATFPPALALAFFILMIAALAVWVRLMLMTPVAAAEPVGPIAIIRRSWRLTGEHYWRLLGAFLLLLVVAVIAVVALTSLLGILVAIAFGFPTVGSPGWTVLIILTTLLQTVFTVLLAVLVARIYLQLRGTTASDVFA